MEKQKYSLFYGVLVKRYTRFGTAVIVLLAFAFLLFVGLHRLVAGDEAFYTLAIRLVAEGKVPYRDFFYPQMPLLPYIYAGISCLTGESNWFLLRLVASLGAATTTYAVFVFLLPRTSWFVAASCLVVLVTSPLFFPWIITVETYSITAPLLLTSVLITEILRKLILTREATATDIALSILAGASLSIATQTRLYSIALLPVLYFYTPPKLRLWHFLAFCACCTPSIGMFMSDPDQFWFNNLGYHLSRAHAPVGRQISGKIQMFLILLGFVPSQKFTGINTALLFWGGTAGAISLIRTIPVVAFSSLVLCAISFVPTPSYYQYFSLIAPFWAIICGVQIFKLAETPIGRRYHLGLFLPAGLVLTGLIGFDTNLHKYIRTGEGVMGIPRWSNPADFSLKATEAVTDRINNRFGPDDVIFSNWNGYLLNARAKPFPGTENIFGIRTASRFPKISKNLGMVSYEDILASIEQGKISGLVIRVQFENTHSKVRQAIRTGRCILVEDVEGVRIYDCRRTPATNPEDFLKGPP